MKKRFSPLHLLSAVFTVLLVVSMGEIASAEVKSEGNEVSVISLTEGHRETTYNWTQKDAAKEKVFVKRAKKNTRTGKTFLRYASAHHPRGTLLIAAKTGNHQYIFTLHSELLILYCVLQI